MNKWIDKNKGMILEETRVNERTGEGQEKRTGQMGRREQDTTGEVRRTGGGEEDKKRGQRREEMTADEKRGEDIEGVTEEMRSE